MISSSLRPASALWNSCSPIHLTGTQTRPLSDIWKDGATALYGTTVPSLPNFGMFYGPNTNLGHNSIILTIEAQSLKLMPKQSRTNGFNDRI